MADIRPPQVLQRHAFVKTTAAAWASFIATRPNLAADPLVATWATRGLPLIARRGTGSTDDQLIPLGLPLPPAHGKRRIAVALPREAIVDVAAPPLLAKARQVAPDHWQESIAQLLALAPDVRCFGSLAWQYLTGLSFLSAGSDLDLLWPLPASGLERLLAAIARLDQHAPMRIDGEIIGPQGGVNWRELHEATGSEVLLKGPHDVCMIARGAFLAGAPV
jgi:phosphoribosyl-dephospho-CoA transferase